MDLNVQFLTAKNQKVFKNMYAFKQKWAININTFL